MSAREPDTISTCGKLVLYKAQLKGCSDLHAAANIAAKVHRVFDDNPACLTPEAMLFLEKYPLDFHAQLSFNIDASAKRWSLEQLKLDSENLTR